ncbi:MAG: stage III sporulation protein AE [Lachnospiraceae bacterium]|nr:stage III sporulation protein AE [Lachnospiraceae bacterium]MCI9545167.1 stage III sporulation protein AE [Lachnospiraceae bacterium]
MRGPKWFFWLFFWLCCAFTPAVVHGATAQQESEGQSAQELLEDMQLEEIQQMVDEMLGEDAFSLTQAVQNLMSGQDVVNKEKALEMVGRIFFSQFDKQRKLVSQALILTLLAALFTNFAQIFDRGQVGEIGFYIVYLLLFTLLLNGYYSLSQQLEERIAGLLELMKGLAPAYYLAVAAASGVTSAAMFYQMVLMLVAAAQWVILAFVLPCTGLYVLLQMVNGLSKEAVLSKLADLFRTLVEWAMKTMMGVLVGMQVIRGLVSPVIDSLRRTTLGKTASAIPGVGNALNAVTEIVLASAVLVRNCLGVAFVLILLIWGATPLIQYSVCALLYKLAAALAQPVSDKRLVSCLSVMGEGCSMLLKILFTTELLCMIAIAVLAVSFGGG